MNETTQESNFIFIVYHFSAILLIKYLIPETDFEVELKMNFISTLMVCSASKNKQNAQKTQKLPN